MVGGVGFAPGEVEGFDSVVDAGVGFGAIADFDVCGEDEVAEGLFGVEPFWFGELFAFGVAGDDSVFDGPAFCWDGPALEGVFGDEGDGLVAFYLGFRVTSDCIGLGGY